MREFVEGYLYLLTDVLYEELCSNDFSIWTQCNILTKHKLVCFYGANNDQTLFICSEKDISKVHTLNGTVSIAPWNFNSVGDYWDNDNIRAVICEADDRKGDTVYVTVALLY